MRECKPQNFPGNGFRGLHKRKDGFTMKVYHNDVTSVDDLNRLYNIDYKALVKASKESIRKIILSVFASGMMYLV